jgi:hypothetical protein
MGTIVERYDFLVSAAAHHLMSVLFPKATGCRAKAFGSTYDNSIHSEPSRAPSWCRCQ